MKKIILPLLGITVFAIAHAQALFTYGSKTVSKNEFIKAFDKNPSADTSSREESLKNYLDLYIRYKLKVQAAYDEHLDKTDEYKSESDNFKKELAESTVNTEANLNNLVHEAVQRSGKDIQLSQLFIPVTPGADTTKAFARMNEAYALLKNGKPFEDVLMQFAGDAAVKQGSGDMGYITVFTLPYEAENMVYALHPGEFTKPYHSRIGYHIFKEISERAAAGSRTIQYILLPTSPSASQEEISRVKKLSDSVYNLISNGASFTDMQALYGVRKTGGDNKAEVSVGQYSPEFEKEVFALQKEGDVSLPFATAYGYNIIKLVEKLKPAVDTNNITANAAMQEKVTADDRLSVAKQSLVGKWMKATGYKPLAYDKTELWKFTDSALVSSKTDFGLKKINQNTGLFLFSTKTIRVDDWLRYVQMKIAEGNAKPSYTALMPQFVSYATTAYYKDYIEEFHPELKPQLKEFNDANLLFAAMDKHVWNKAATDSIGLLQYYKAHSSKYIWAQGADAIVITANNKQVADELKTKIEEKPADWRSLTASYGSLAQADSNRFERDQLPVKNADTIREHSFAGPAVKTDGGTYSLVYITKIHSQPEPRSFEDAKGMVINDYQQLVEDKWIAELKKKYPVKVNETVFQSIR